MDNESTEMYTGLSQEEKTLGMLCHLLGLLGFIGPLIMWLVKKDSSEFIDDQGKEALNFQLTVLIASFVSSILVFVIVGIFLMIALVIINIVCIIKGSIAANEGKRYRYPYSFKLIT